MDHVAPTRQESVEQLGKLCEEFSTKGWHAAKQGDYAAAATHYASAESASWLAFHISECEAARGASRLFGTQS